jgi:hypothetical protein
MVTWSPNRETVCAAQNRRNGGWTSNAGIQRRVPVVTVASMRRFLPSVDARVRPASVDYGCSVEAGMIVGSCREWRLSRRW